MGHKSFYKVFVTGIVAAGASVAIYTGVVNRSPVNPGTAFVNVGGFDTGNCVINAPCATINYAIGQIPCGSSIKLAAGNYPQQSINYQSAMESCSSSSRIVIGPSLGATVNIAGLTLGAGTVPITKGPKHLDFEGINFTTATTAGQVDVGWLSDDIVFNQIVMDGPRLVFDGASNAIVSNSEFKNCAANASLPNCPEKVEAGGGATSHLAATAAQDSTTLTLVNASSFQSSGFIRVGPDDNGNPTQLENGSAIIAYTGKSGNVLTGVGPHPAYTNGGNAIGELFTNTNITFTHDKFHDNTTTNAVNWHTECFYINQVTGLSIDHSILYHCEIYDVFFQATGVSGTAIKDVSMINNLFDIAWNDPTGSTTVGTCVAEGNNGSGSPSNPSQVVDNWTFAFNSMFIDPAFGGDGKNHGCGAGIIGSGTETNSHFYGNIYTSSGCTSGVTYSYNVHLPFSQFTGNSSCGTGESVVTYNQPSNVKYTNFGGLPTPGDYHLLSGAPGLNLVPGIMCPSDDYYGTPRPTGAGQFCNAGAIQ